jgi:tungstate transport system ATP-binding protein
MTLVPPRTGVFNTSVCRNVAYGLKVRGVPAARIEEQVAKALSFVVLEQKKKQNARTLSSGETQRLGIARALAIGPEIQSLGEPTASVDEDNTAIIESGRSMVIMTSHDKERAERLADTLLFMSGAD